MNRLNQLDLKNKVNSKTDNFMRKTFLLPLLYLCTFFLSYQKQKYYQRILRRAISIWRIPTIVYRRFFLNNIPYKYQYAVAAILKNEASYIQEWICYHLLMGFEHFYLYNNNSTDNIHEVLKPYIKKGIVTLTDYPGEAKQIEAYIDVVLKYEKETKWLAILDIDEFIQSASGTKLPDFLNKEKFANQYTLMGYMYGTSHHKSKPDGLVIENYTFHASSPYTRAKSIIRPFFCFSPHVHSSHCYGGSIEVLPTEFLLNHYYSKSEEEFLRKNSRGDAMFHNKPKPNLNFNDIEDKSMHAYVDIVKKMIKEISEDEKNNSSITKVRNTKIINS